MSDPVREGLRERLARYHATGDRDAVLDLEAELELAALLGPHEGFDTEAAHVGGMVHWARYRAGSTSEEDLAEAVRLLAEVHDRAEGLEIPGPVRLILECRRAG
ncbi:hypothetical protein ACIGEZ_28420 [Streptomyces sp. NPDC085481]|uniref:hypothetical protein n=1 Tax=Streptomyces sp. NPDC085481 TaxID=3365727 RepID=UPI0037CFDCFD